MSDKKKKMTRQVRISESTAKLIDAILRHNPEYTSFAEVIDRAFSTLYDDLSDVVWEKEEEIAEIINNRMKRQDQ